MPKDGAAKPTALDSLFILFASILVLFLLIWTASVLMGRELFTDLPTWLKDAVSSIWSKVILGSGTAGTLVLRKWLDKRPSINYLLWIPAFTIFFALVLFLVVQLLPPSPIGHHRVPIRFTLKLTNQSTTGTAFNNDNDLLVKPVSPNSKDLILLQPVDQREQNAYRIQEAEIPSASSQSNFVAEINHKANVSRGGSLKWRGWEYRICLKANPDHPFPTYGAKQSTDELIKLECLPDEEYCSRASDDPRHVLKCGERTPSSRGFISRVYAAEPSQAAPQSNKLAWVVPSLKTLEDETDRQRVGYTRFEVSFKPIGRADLADRYYHILRVNDQPIYVDGFLPDRIVSRLERGKTNLISFALENLNFTGQNAGAEKLNLTIVFLQGEKEIYRQELERGYIALRDAEEIAPIKTEVGTFIWTGKYVAPKRENKYELFLGSAMTPQGAMDAKAHFDKLKLKVDGRPAVLVVRPPLKKKNNKSYGMVVGLVLPTSQVQFTFNADEARALCHWAGENKGKGPAGRIIRPDYSLYEIAADRPVSCN